jgi:hypothetical protein
MSQIPAHLVDAIDRLLPAARSAWWKCNPPLDEEGYAALRPLHAAVVGLAARAGLPAPPALEEAGFAVHRRVDLSRDGTGAPVGYMPTRGGRGEAAWREWAARLTDLRAAAAAMADPPAAARPSDGDGRWSADTMVCPSDLAARFGVPQAALEARLRRWREAHPEEAGRGWIEANDRAPRQARYLYSAPAVRPVIDALRASGERRPKKKFAQG